MGDHSSTYSSKYFCFGATLVLLGCVLLCALGFTIVYPHNATRTWPTALCRVQNVTYQRDICSCDQPYDENGDCYSKYPCLHVQVTYNTSENGSVASGMLFRHWSDAFYGECSLYECGDEHWNVKTVRQFQREYGVPGALLLCYPDPSRPHVLVLWRTPTAAVIHAVFWPGLCLLVGSVVWLGMCLGCWKFEEDPEARSKLFKS